MHRLAQAWLGTAARRIAAAVAFSGVIGSGAAYAQDYAARDLGPWEVAASEDGSGCFLTRTYAGTGETTLLLGLDVRNENHLSILNDNWSIKPRESLKLNFRLSKGGYPKHAVVGMASGGKHGFVTSFDPAFLSHFASSSALHVDRGDVVVEQLRLDGSGAAIAELRRCAGLFKASASGNSAVHERSRRIPKDPFAPDAARESKR